jgi:hypothetical protein
VPIGRLLRDFARAKPLAEKRLTRGAGLATLLNMSNKHLF